MADTEINFTDKEALLFHSQGRPGKIEITPSKPMATQRDLSLAYSPGVAIPVKAIAENPDAAYDYTAKGNLVAVISNGSAILGLGDLGALAAKPVMEGKAVLFKRFADVDSIDLEVDTSDVEAFINCVSPLGPSFGGINLEDIKAPDCFIIEERLREMMDIPVFHDDQHGTAIITAAGFLNALDLTGRDIKKTRVVVNGAGAASIACTELMKAMGLPAANVIMCDSKGVIYQGREDGMNQWKSAHAAKTDHRTLAEALKGADAFIGLSVKGAMTAKMVRSMADQPIIFAMANPDPEITPEEVAAIREDAIMATGRSDYPNQVNNVLGFPYIFRGALDVRATTINDAMKIAAAEALAELAREDVPDEVSSAYHGKRLQYGPEYIIPAPFDPRLIECIPMRVAQAAMDTGVARKPILDMEEYREALGTRLNPTVALLAGMFAQLKRKPRRVVFAEAEEDRVLRAAVSFSTAGYGEPILIGQEDIVREKLSEMGEEPARFEIVSARGEERRDRYVEFLYGKLGRKGFLRRDVLRKVNRDRNVFGACMVAMGEADAMVSGVTRNFWQTLDNVTLAIDSKPGRRPFGLAILLARGRTVFVADTTLHEQPNAEELADVAVYAADAERRLGHEPRVAFISYANFGSPKQANEDPAAEAARILHGRNVDFEFDGEMAVDTALNPDLSEFYPFSNLTGAANVLIMPGLRSANISYKLLAELGGGRVIGPLLWGLEKPVQIARMSSKDTDLVNLAAFAAVGSLERD